MIERELREIKRRFRPERSNIAKIVGCFVNENKQIIYRINQPVEFSDSVISERLLTTMKKTLSGSLGTNLTNIDFSTKQVLESEKHKLLMKLRETHLSDSEALESLYSLIIESLSIEGNYVILLANDIYDVFEYGKEGEKGESNEVFSYLVCAVCPVKNLPEALTFKESDCLFHAMSISGILSSPELGFMFPTFDDRKTNIYGALYYTKSLAENYPDFARNVLEYEAKMPPKAQKAAFDSCVSDALSEECSYEVIRSVHTQISELIEQHKQSKDPEPLTITKATVKTVLENCGVAEEKLEKLDTALDESFGKNAEISPKNIISPRKFELATPDVKIKVDPEHRDLVSTQVINNVKYVMIRVEGEVEVNGIAINIET